VSPLIQKTMLSSEFAYRRPRRRHRLTKGHLPTVAQSYLHPWLITAMKDHAGRLAPAKRVFGPYRITILRQIPHKMCPVPPHGDKRHQHHHRRKKIFVFDLN
jgi:hypothetical protein